MTSKGVNNDGAMIAGEQIKMPFCFMNFVGTNIRYLRCIYIYPILDSKFIVIENEKKSILNSNWKIMTIKHFEL